MRAFDAGPRCDPMARVAHVESLVRQARLIETPGNKALRCKPAASQSVFGAGVKVPPGAYNNLELDLEEHAYPRRIIPPGPPLGASYPAGAHHPHLGLFADYTGDPTSSCSKHYPTLTASLTEEQRRIYLLTGERHRRHAERRYRPSQVFGAPAIGVNRFTTSERPATAYVPAMDHMDLLVATYRNSPRPTAGRRPPPIVQHQNAASWHH
jgi:hypothetical protein